MGYKVESDFNHKYRCVIILSKQGHRCGYVGVSNSHPLYGVDYSAKIEGLKLPENEPIGKRGILSLVCGSENSLDVYFNVHGSLTFSSGSKEYPVESDLWWFGFDCNHLDDASDIAACKEAFGEVPLYPSQGTIRTLEYVTQECKNLADQLEQYNEVAY